MTKFGRRWNPGRDSEIEFPRFGNPRSSHSDVGQGVADEKKANLGDAFVVESFNRWEIKKPKRSKGGRIIVQLEPFFLNRRCPHS